VLGGGSYLVFYTKSNSDRCYNRFWLFVSFTARTNNCVLSDFNLWKLKIESRARLSHERHTNVTKPILGTCQRFLLSDYHGCLNLFFIYNKKIARTVL